MKHLHSFHVRVRSFEEGLQMVDSTKIILLYRMTARRNIMLYPTNGRLFRNHSLYFKGKWTRNEDSLLYGLLTRSRNVKARVVRSHVFLVS